MKMTTDIKKIITSFCIALTMVGCNTATQTPDKTKALVNSATLPTFPCLNAPKVSSATPGDTPITSQDGLNCFAWQNFIGLNWTVDNNNPGEPDNSVLQGKFGLPGVSQTTVWETYANIKNVMRPHAEQPRDWGYSGIPAACKAVLNGADHNQPVRVMSSTRTSGDFNLSEDAAQAFPSNNPNWLADKNGSLVYYEVLIGKSEYDFIKDNGLYNQATQVSFLEAGNNIALPQGHVTTAGKNVQGGLEIKAAWLQVSDPTASKWTRYKLTRAYILDPITNSCSEQSMALVGMHIILKTASQPQWVWATFEHVDNSPDTAQIKPDGTVDGDFTFYGNTCTEQALPQGSIAKTIKGVPVTKTSCEANISPAYELYNTKTQATFPPYPIRVSREFPIVDSTSNHVASLNKATQHMIKEANPTSVFANYELVNVLWSSASVNDQLPPGNPPITPLSTSGETPSISSIPVANTMLETYAQGFNCLSCHANASISSSAGAKKSYATDYSFIFGTAKRKKK
jgi:hypothetical protein